MSNFATELYSKLISLVKDNEAFFFQDFQLDSATYRIFNYRLASYSDFQNPGALEARGIMFEIDENKEAIRIASMPMHKFFNLNENPSTMNVDLDTVISVEVKSDGSLISSFIHFLPNGDKELRLKSKGSLFSQQAIDALEWLKTQPEFYEFVEKCASCDITVNMEWVSPDNRIVLGYMEPRLIILNFRDMVDGAYVDVVSKQSKKWMLPQIIPFEMTYKEFVESIPSMTDDIEGFVVKTSSGLWFKVKTDKYVSLHHAKDSVTNPRRLLEVILDEGIDDLRSMFVTDQLVQKQISEMETKVTHIYNHMVSVVEGFYNENKELSRKEYAIKGQQILPSLFFSSAMNLYLGKGVNYKEFIKAKYKDFGFNDVSNSNE